MTTYTITRTPAGGGAPLVVIILDDPDDAIDAYERCIHTLPAGEIITMLSLAAGPGPAGRAILHAVPGGA